MKIKNLLFLLLLAFCNKGFSQLPYFQQEHTSATAGYDYQYPVDIHYDGSSKIYSYHASDTGGIIVVKYNSSTGALISAFSISKSGNTYTPVCVKTYGSNYYVMFNTTVSGQSRFCILGLNNTTNTVTFNRTIAPMGTATLDLVGKDFTFDGSGNIYVASLAYDQVNMQGDICITKINTATQTITWNNVYRNTARSENPANIVYRSASEIIVSSRSGASLTDRGIALLEVNSSGAFVNSKLYRYNNCSTVRITGTWVANNASTLYLTATSYVGADANGPFWIGKINPATLAITAQENYDPGSSYMNAEIQEVASGTGTKLLMSGSASYYNTPSTGYTHFYFNASTLAFHSGKRYGTTFSTGLTGEIYDTYINSGTDLSVFSVARNDANNNNYYLLKTSTLGINDCDTAALVFDEGCVMYDSAFTVQVISPEASLPLIKPVVTAISNDYDETCGIYCSDCALTINESLTEEAAAPGDKMMQFSGRSENNVMVYPNPATSQVTVNTKGLQVSGIRLLGVDGKLIRTLNVVSDQVSIDLSGLEKGVYLLQMSSAVGQKTVRIIRE